jgi:hypothetical protein
VSYYICDECGSESFDFALNCFQCEDRAQTKAILDTMRAGAIAVGALALSLACGGCYPAREYDCMTPGGLMVQGAACAAVHLVQMAIEDEAKALGMERTLKGAMLYVRTDEVGEHGQWYSPEHKSEIGGQTYCDGPLMIVGVGADTNAWGQTSFAHEAFHVLQNCWLDLSAEDPMHPRWERYIYPAIAKINSVSMEVGL